MKIYIAASMHSKKEAKDVAINLQFQGHVITSTWFENQSYDKVNDAMADLSEIMQAECVVFLTKEPSSEGGRHIEFGFALGKKKRLIILGERESCFTYLDYVEQYDSLDDLIKCL